MTYFRSQNNFDPDMEQEVEDALRNYYKCKEQSIDPSDTQQSDANETKKKNTSVAFLSSKDSVITFSFKKCRKAKWQKYFDILMFDKKRSYV